MKLRTHRILKGLTQWDLGLKIGRSQTQVSLMERGYVIPDDAVRSRIADLFQVDPSTIEFPGIKTRTLDHQSDERDC